MGNIITICCFRIEYIIIGISNGLVSAQKYLLFTLCFFSIDSYIIYFGNKTDVFVFLHVKPSNAGGIPSMNGSQRRMNNGLNHEYRMI